MWNWVTREWRKRKHIQHARKGLPIEELQRSIERGLSGTGGLLHACPGIRSRLADRILDVPQTWFVPVITTEASPRVVSIASDRGIHHAVVWDERFTHYLERIAWTYEASLRVRPAREEITRAFSVIALDYVLEQLNPRNRLCRASSAFGAANRILSGVYHYCTTDGVENRQIEHALLHAPEFRNPDVLTLVGSTVQMARGLTLDHELQHFLNKYGSWDDQARLEVAANKRKLIDSIAHMRGVTSSGNLPPGRTWPYFETVFGQLPLSLLDFGKRALPEDVIEELHCDLVPIILLCAETKEILNHPGAGEMHEFKALAHCYRVCRIWQIANAFLQGLRLEVGSALGRPQKLTGFFDNDIGIRLMLGNHICYDRLVSPPYFPEAPTPEGSRDTLTSMIERTRAYSKLMPYNRGAHHRLQFLEHYERSDQMWIHILNDAALLACDVLSNAAEAPAGKFKRPSNEQYLNQLGISHRSSGIRQ